MVNACRNSTAAAGSGEPDIFQGGFIRKQPIEIRRQITSRQQRNFQIVLGRTNIVRLNPFPVKTPSIIWVPSLAVEESSNWNKRYRENLLRMKSGDLYEVARVIKGLMFRERKRGLSNGERKMLHTARQILLSELVLAEDSGYEEVERRVEQAMLQTPEIQR